MVEVLGISLLSPIVKSGVTKLVKWIADRRKEKKQAEKIADLVSEKIEAQKEVDVEVEGPVYGGYSNHWIENLQSGAQAQDVNYSYLGNQIESRIERNKNLSVLQLDMPRINKDLLREVIMKDYWKVQNDRKHGNGVFTMAIPQQATAKVEDEVVTFTAEGIGSVPINGRYMFNKEISGFQFDQKDPNPEDFYKGGRLEIPVEITDSDYDVFPVAPPPSQIPDYAIRRPQFTEEVIKEPPKSATTQPFIFCPLCGAKMMTGGSRVKFCMSCGKNIEKFMPDE